MGMDTARTAWGGIASHKLRSGLTILGMTIGVAAVIVLIAVGNGSSRSVQSRIQSLGTNVLVVLSRRLPRRDAWSLAHDLADAGRRRSARRR